MVRKQRRQLLRPLQRFSHQRRLVVGRVKMGLNKLYGAVKTVKGLGTMYKHARQLKRSPLSLMRVLSIVFYIVLTIVQKKQKVKMVAPRNFRPLSGIGHLVVEYVNCYSLKKGVRNLKFFTTLVLQRYVIVTCFI